MSQLIRQHVFSDLRPYNCLEPGCTHAETGFVRRKDWFSHIVREHWRTWTCPLGCAERFTTSSLFSEHMDQKHGSAATPPEVDAGSRDDLTKANGKCPLCREHDIVSSHQYRSHVGHHLEQLALFVLPGTEEVEEEIEEEEENGISQSESHETEDEDQPADNYEQEQDVALDGSPKQSAEILTEEERKMEEEEAAKLKYENEARLRLEKDRLDTEEAKNKEEAAKEKREELLKKIEEETKIKLEVAEEAMRAAGDEKEPIKFKDAVGRKFHFPWRLCATWTVSIASLPSCYYLRKYFINLENS